MTATSLLMEFVQAILVYFGITRPDHGHSPWKILLEDESRQWLALPRGQHRTGRPVSEILEMCAKDFRNPPVRVRYRLNTKAAIGA